MAAANTLTTLNTMFKYVQDQAESLLPDNSVLLRLIPKLTPPNQIGRNNFLIPVQLTHENGVTYCDGGVDTLNAASAAVYSEISVPASPMILQTQISDSVANRMAVETKTFINEASLRAEVMYNSLARRYEISMLYGLSPTGLGLSIVAGSSASGTTVTIVLNTASWAPGIWAGAVGASFNLYNPTSSGSLVNSTAAIVCTAVVASTYTVTFSCNSSDTSAINTAVGTAGCILTFYGSTSTNCITGNDMTGLDSQIVGGVSYFGIDPTVYPLWQGNTYNCNSAALTMGKILAGSGQCVAIGGLDSELIVSLSAASYANVNSDQAALRQYDESFDGKDAENGTEDISYRGPNGKITLVVNNIEKQGEAHGFPKKHVKRVGVKEMSFLKPGTQDQFFQELPTQTGYQIRCSGEFSIVLMKPAQAIKWTSIVNS
jgi:hypothetical protein